MITEHNKTAEILLYNVSKVAYEGAYCILSLFQNDSVTDNGMCYPLWKTISNFNKIKRL